MYKRQCEKIQLPIRENAEAEAKSRKSNDGP